MGSITTGVGLISGINSAQLIDQLIALESTGKTRLQQRIADLQTQSTAMLDINARLLNLKNAARSFRFDKVFQSMSAASSDEDVIAATASKTAQAGIYKFIVKQLVSTSQKLSKGFADKTSSPLGLTSMSFEFGHGGLSSDKSLEELNGGTGIDRGHIKITDRSGATATIDLTDVTSLDEVVGRISDASGVKVTASLSGDRLVITDDTGLTASSLIVANGDGDTTATTLGIAGTAAGNTLTGTVINTVGSNTSLASLNDGTGVLVKNNVPSLAITARDGTALSVDLGRVNQPISSSTLLADLNNGLGVKISTDETNKDIKFVDRTGTAYEVNLTGVTTVGGLITRVATATGGKVALSINADGKRLTVTDTSGGTGSLKVLGDGTNATKTAEDLGILNATGVAANSFDGGVVPNLASSPAASTIGDVITRINGATGNGGKIVASLSSDGVSLLITDTTGGGGNLIIASTTGNPYAAKALGIETAPAGVAANSVDGTRLVAGLGSTLVSNLNGGDGLSGNSSLTITNRAGVSFTVNNLTSYDSTSDLTAAINAAATTAGANITVGLNANGNGLKVTDSSGGTGNLIVGGTAASSLGVATAVTGVASASVEGTNLQLRYVSEASRLGDLNYGKGVGTGVFKITDATGASATVDIGSDSLTLHDVIQEINSRGLAINARVNDKGDGLIIESALGVGQVATSKLKVASVSGSVAKDLNIVGESETVANGFVDGSYERTVEFDATDTLAKVVSKINAAGIPVSASILATGAGATPYRLNLTSGISGRLGELHVDSGSVDLGLTSLSEGRDAKVFFGSDDPENGLLITSGTNTISTAIDGVTIDLKEASDDPVTVTIERDTASMKDAVKKLITGFNDAIGRANQYDFYDVDTKKKGALLGDSTVAVVRQGLYRIAYGKAQGVTTQYQYLSQVGITIGKNGEMNFDETKFDTAYENDPDAVKNLFASYESSAAPTEEISPGVTVQRTEQVVSVRGFGDLFDNLLDGLTNSVDGVVTRASRNFKSIIDDTNDRISDFDERLDAKRKRLESQFAAMESALAKLQDQSGALGQLANSVALAKSGGQ